ncbi:conserved hypothetical protein [Ricinus communis]|uniref:Uncharacterized protein n=1 Tax=Ricinus communis TaxID=3988 RepID=B9S3G8_RICCO|nr:conserved hypothetical protein [Ricinus communis]
MVLREESQRSIHAQSQVLNDAAEMAVKKGKSSLYCTHCSKTWHLKEKCYKLIGFPANFKFTKVKSQDLDESMRLRSFNQLSLSKEQTHKLMSLLDG